MRVDKDQRLAASEDKLIDCEQGLWRQVLWVNQQQHVDIGRDRIRFSAKRFDVVKLTQLLENRHRLARLAPHHGHHVALERQRADHPDYSLFWHGKGVDQLCQIVFEKAFALGRKERNDLLIVGRIGGGEAEVNSIALAVERHRL